MELRQILFAVLLAICLAFVTQNPVWAVDSASETPVLERTLRDLAHSNGIRGGDLAEELGLPRSIAKDRPVSELQVTAEQVQEAVARLKGEGEATAPPADAPAVVVDAQMSIRQLAHANDVNGMALTHGLQLPLGVDKDTPVSELGITQAKLRDVLLHLKYEEGASLSFLKYWLWPPLLLLVLWWLRSGGQRKSPAKGAYSPWVLRGVLVLVVVVFGFWLGKAPNPMEGVVKVFKAQVGIYGDLPIKLLWLGYFSVLAVIGNKLICGWGCPFGALQELIYEIPLLRHLKQRKLPFVWTMTLRTFLFVAFILALFGWLGNVKGVVIYHYVNPFNLFGLELGLWTVACSIVVFLLLSLFIYRPFCQLICPFGWYSWFLERVSLNAIRINRERCNSCGACARACPLQAAEGRLAGSSFPADCFSCARCLRVCPQDAIGYGRPLSKK